MDLTSLMETIQNLVLNYGLNLIWAIIIFIVGRWAAGVLSGWVKKAMDRTDVSATLARFVSTLVYYGILAFAIIAAFERLGVETTSFVAIVGAAGLAIGLALQGSLANFAAGVLILFFRPFKVDDLVEVSGIFGRIEDIQVFNTILLTLDHKTVIMPNSQVTSGHITNYSKKGFVRVDLVFGIGYGDDLLKAKGVLQEIADGHPKVRQEPAPEISVMELGDNSVNFAVRPYADANDYWDVYFDITEQVKLRFDEEGISIPFPQRDVHLYQADVA